MLRSIPQEIITHAYVHVIDGCLCNCSVNRFFILGRSCAKFNRWDMDRTIHWPVTFDKRKQVFTRILQRVWPSFVGKVPWFRLWWSLPGHAYHLFYKISIVLKNIASYGYVIWDIWIVLCPFRVIFIVREKYYSRWVIIQFGSVCEIDKKNSYMCP